MRKERMSLGQGTGQENFKVPFKELQGPVRYEEVKKAMEAMKRGKGVGVDKVRLNMLQDRGEILSPNLDKVLQCCCEEELIPDE